MNEKKSSLKKIDQEFARDSTIRRYSLDISFNEYSIYHSRKNRKNLPFLEIEKQISNGKNLSSVQSQKMSLKEEKDKNKFAFLKRAKNNNLSFLKSAQKEKLAK